MLRSSWLLYLSGTLVSGFDDFPLEPAARNNGTANTAGAQDFVSQPPIRLKKEMEYVNSGSYQQQKEALAIVLPVGEIPSADHDAIPRGIIKLFGVIVLDNFCLFAQWRAFEMTNAGFTV
ncbi:hypothetical protein Tco_0476108 [Tanacetum coccineum]